MRMKLMRWALALVVITGGMSLLAGRPPDAWLWSYIGVFAAVSLYALLVLSSDLARERLSPPERGADATWLRWIRVLALAHLVVAGLGARWHWGPVVPAAVRLAALAAMGLGFALVFRAMRENQFFSAVVRIQRDRGQHVVDTGPYSIVRHPGYAGMIVGVPMSGLALGSWPAFAVACLYSALMLRRVVFEDRFLREGLEGYAAYTTRVRYRLLPGIW